MARKYDPIYHSNVVRNYRRMYKATIEEDCNALTDEEIWNIAEDTPVLATSEEHDEAVIENLEEAIAMKEGTDDVPYDPD